ncbi:MAG: radical SAM protein [Lachnospiraceae bacterium]|nr:radical SAM protein [Lachnospiraceae bacterium]
MDRKIITKGCTLCPRVCGADRGGGQKGRCHVDSRIRVARAALHFWEEPCISGPENTSHITEESMPSLCLTAGRAASEKSPREGRTSGKRGSGAVFFSGCPLGCVFCQNRAISRGEAGTVISVERLADIFLELQDQGAYNINLVTAGHYAPQVCEALCLAKQKGLILPVVWNSSGYEKVEMLRMLEGLVDIYLPDFKYLDPQLARRYSHAEDYPEVAKRALCEMVRQQPTPRFDEAGMMTAGVLVRHLLLPGHVREAKQVVSYLWETYGNQIYISLMNQYTPPGQSFHSENAAVTGYAKDAASLENVDDCRKKVTLERSSAWDISEIDPLLARRVTKREYERLLDYAAQLGIEQGFYQEGGTAAESFIPVFDGTGVCSGQ